jgi:uncharacterized oligopeptide transporter (OPT) family protein
MLAYAFKAVARGISNGIYRAGQKAGKDLHFIKMKPQDNSSMIQDPAADHELPQMYLWASGLILSMVSMCIVMKVQYDVPVGITLVSIILTIFFSFLAIQCTGVTDTTPLTAASKASQIILGGATKAQHWPIERAQMTNLMGGALASAGANQSTDLTTDFRVGFLLRTPPNQQWYAQGLGTLIAVFLSPLMFWVFMKA